MVSRETVLQKLKCSPNLYPRILEDKFPHVLENIVQLWGTHDCELYLADLLNPSYSGGRYFRRGFPIEAWKEILMLLYNKPLLKSAK